MKYRKLRIAWSVLWGVVAVLLILGPLEKWLVPVAKIVVIASYTQFFSTGVHYEANFIGHFCGRGTCRNIGS